MHEFVNIGMSFPYLMQSGYDRFWHEKNFRYEEHFVAIR